MKPQPIRTAEAAMFDLYAMPPQRGRIRSWLREALEIALCAALVVAGFYGLLFIMLLGA